MDDQVVVIVIPAPGVLETYYLEQLRFVACEIGVLIARDERRRQPLVRTGQGHPRHPDRHGAFGFGQRHPVCLHYGDATFFHGDIVRAGRLVMVDVDVHGTAGRTSLFSMQEAARKASIKIVRHFFIMGMLDQSNRFRISRCTSSHSKEPDYFSQPKIDITTPKTKQIGQK